MSDANPLKFEASAKKVTFPRSSGVVRDDKRSVAVSFALERAAAIVDLSRISSILVGAAECPSDDRLK